MNNANKTFYPYTQWEDYQNGMYGKAKSNPLLLIQKSITLFSNPELLKLAMMKVIRDWPIASSHNLGVKSLNRRSWLGQAACNIDHNIPELLNRDAWNALSKEQMIAANNVANEVIQQWETTNEELLKL